MELVDVYDLRRRRTGKVLLREDVFKNLADDERILLVHTCVFNSDGRMLIQRRQKTKEHYPGCWDVSAGGFVLAGEKSLDAAVREIKEELAADIEVHDLVEVVDHDYEKFHLHMHCFWATVKNGELYLLEHEAAKWLTKDTISDVDWLPADKGLVEKIKESL